MFCMQLVQNNEVTRLRRFVRKMFDIVGCVTGKLDKGRCCGRFEQAIEVSLMNSGRDRVMVCYESNEGLEVLGRNSW